MLTGFDAIRGLSLLVLYSALRKFLFFPQVLRFASQAKNQSDLFRKLFYVISSHQQSTCIRLDNVATQIDIVDYDACYN